MGGNSIFARAFSVFFSTLVSVVSLAVFVLLIAQNRGSISEDIAQRVGSIAMVILYIGVMGMVVLLQRDRQRQ